MKPIPLPELTRQLSIDRGRTSIFVLEISHSADHEVLVEMHATLNDETMRRSIVATALIAGLRGSLEQYEQQHAAELLELERK